MAASEKRQKFAAEVASALGISKRDAEEWFGSQWKLGVDEVVRLVRLLEDEGKGKRWKPIDYSIH